jgi:hypothetical protein
MTIIFSFKDADSQYLKIIFNEKKEKSVSKTKIDFFVLTKRSLLIDFSRVFVIWENSWYLIADYFLHADFFTADSFLTANFFLTAHFFLTADYLALNDFWQSFFVLNVNVIIVVENENIWLFEMTLLSNEFEELFVVRQILFV